MDNPTTSNVESYHQIRQENTIINQPRKLTRDESTELEKCIPGSSRQFRRMVRYLAENPDSETTSVCRATASVNLSDVARKHNHLIQKVGFEVRCRKPAYTIRNRFGEHSNQYLWGLYSRIVE